MSSAIPRTDPGRGSWRTATVVASEPVTERVARLRLLPSPPFAFTPGQHVDVRLTAPDGYQARRSYSIASAPEEAPAIELLVERLADGEVSPYLTGSLAAGDVIELRGPIGGHFVWTAADGGPLLLVAGGSGVVPFLSMLRHRRLAKSKVPVTLVYSVARRADMLGRDVVEPLDDGARVFVTATREAAPEHRSDHRSDHRFDHRFGRVDAALLTEALRPAPTRVMICGSNAFVGAIGNLLLERGVAPAITRTERYGG